MNRHLLGFYCEGHLPVSISGDTPFFKDKSQSARMVATIVPIKCIQTQSEWLMIPNMFDVPQSLQSVFDQQLILTTATDEDSKTNHVRYAVLMHALENAPEMARTGVLLHRVRDSWEPMVVKFRDVPYLVECKGVGSPLGGYVSFHQRTQAGTSKTHTRVTGGLLQESMSAEFENLMRVQSYHQFTVPGILPLACIGFEFITNENTLNMGLLLRLTRSNIRYSYEDFGSFSDDKPNVYAMFSQQNQLLFSAGLRHQNLTANNLVYHDSSHYVVTDYEELTPIYKAPTSLDSDASSVPLFLKIYPFRFLYQSLYTTPEANVFFDPTIANQEIDQQFIQSQPILKDYVSATRSFLLPGYDEIPLKQWAQDVLIPNLKRQQMILQEWIEQREASENASFDTIIRPHLGHLHLDPTRVMNDVSEFNHRTHMGIMFLFPNDCSLYKLKWRVAYIDRLLRQLAVCIDDDDATFNIQSSYQTPFLYISDDYEYWDAQLLLFPFLQWVSHWADFLARYFNAYPTALPLVNRLKNDLKNSQSLYDHFIDNSSDSILSYITRY